MISRNALLFVVMCLVWGLTWLPLKLAAGHVPPVLLMAARFLIGGVVMMALAGRSVLAVPAAAWPRLIATALLLNTANYSLLVWGVTHAPSGLAAIVNFSTIPIYIVLAERAITGQPIDARKLSAIVLGAVGICCLFLSRARLGLAVSQGDPMEAVGLAAVAAGTAFYCTGAVLARPIAGSIPTLALAGWQTLIGGIGLAAVSLAVERVGSDEIASLARWPVWPSLTFLIIAGSLIGFTIYLRLLRDWGAFRAGLYAFVSPAIAVAVGIVVLGEPFGGVEALGALLMFAAAAIALRR